MRWMVEDTHVHTKIIEYRLRVEGDGINDKARGPRSPNGAHRPDDDGLSMVYSFFDPALSERSSAPT